ncbi:hypothetical protein E4T56_gene16170 [Termitomyces sp. T112]|nr:hypothetical protein E4T56_gene16170 [Termitomyces sp. T112]
MPATGKITPSLSDVQDKFREAFPPLSAASNAVVTLLVGVETWKLWRRRQLWEIDSMRQKSLVQTVMLLIVKSGRIDCVLQIINAIVSDRSISSPSDYDTPFIYVSVAFNNIFVWATAIYPMAVILVARIIAQQIEDD